jgi:Lon protease-like protein
MISLPLFPLSTVLFPGGQLSLQVFEVRYLDMIRQCINNSSTFGIVSLTSGSEIRLPGKTETFSQIGTLVNIIEWSSPRPGLLQIVCEGTRRFRIYTIEQQRHGLWVADYLDMLDHDKEIPIPDELIDTSTSLENLLYTMKMQGMGESELTVAAPYRLNGLPTAGQNCYRFLWRKNKIFSHWKTRCCVWSLFRTRWPNGICLPRHPDIACIYTRYDAIRPTSDNRPTIPDQTIWMPMHNKMNADKRNTTIVPSLPRRRTTVFA